MPEICPLTLLQLREIYEQRMVEDFPPDELKPLWMIERALDEGRYSCFGWFEGREILAYALFVRLGRTALFDYYAVRRDLRDSGVGSRFIRALIEGPLAGMDCVLLEVDDPDEAPDERELDVRERRLRFYMRNGLRDTGARATVFGVAFRILALPVGPMPGPEAARRVYSELYRAMLPEKLYREQVHIRDFH